MPTPSGGHGVPGEQGQLGGQENSRVRRAAFPGLPAPQMRQRTYKCMCEIPKPEK